MQWLAVRGARIVDERSRPVQLRGFCVGGWMNLENFINGYPGHPSTFAAALGAVLGKGKAGFFFDRMMDHFLAEEDLRYMAALGATCVRLPLNYRHFESDERPFAYLAKGFARLDRAIGWCRAHGLYAILDLHAAQGWQNPDWHSDNPTNVALLWTHRQFQDRVAGLWKELARRYRREPAVAGYNVLNEPVCKVPGALPRVYRLLTRAIRSVDSRHLLFLEGNDFSRDFSELQSGLDRLTVLSNHHYPAPAFTEGRYPGEAWGRRWDRAAILADQRAATAFMRRRGLPVWTGEFGTVYRGGPRDVDRLRVLDDTISVFEELGHHWTHWTYKDVGMMGTVTVDPGSPWFRATARGRALKAALGSDTWGQRPHLPVPAAIRTLGARVGAQAKRHGMKVDPFTFWLPFGTASRLMGGILVSEAIVRPFAEQLRGFSEKKLDALAASFAFANCRIREPQERLLARWFAAPVN